MNNCSKFNFVRSYIIGPQNNQRFPPRKDGEPKTIMTRKRLQWTGHLARMPGIRLPKETTWRPTSSIQGSTQKVLAENINRSGRLGDGRWRKNYLGKSRPRKKHQKKKKILQKHQKTNRIDEMSPKLKSHSSPSHELSCPTMRWLRTYLPIQYRTHYAEGKCQWAPQWVPPTEERTSLSTHLQEKRSLNRTFFYIRLQSFTI